MTDRELVALMAASIGTEYNGESGGIIAAVDHAQALLREVDSWQPQATGYVPSSGIITGISDRVDLRQPPAEAASTCIYCGWGEGHAPACPQVSKTEEARILSEHDARLRDDTLNEAIAVCNGFAGKHPLTSDEAINAYALAERIAALKSRPQEKSNGDS